MLLIWLTNNSIELFGAVTGIIYVILEIRQNTWLWPVGIVTSAVYIWVFFTGKLYADMGLQVYYVLISVLGWYWWVRGAGQGAGSREQVAVGSELRTEGAGQGAGIGDSPFEEPALSGAKWGKGDVRNHITKVLPVTRIKPKLALKLTVILVFIYIGIYLALSNLSDSPVPGWDALITSLSIIGTWMLARKIYEHWYLWIVVNIVATGLFFVRGLYPTAFLYLIYLVMSFSGLRAWGRVFRNPVVSPESE